MMAQISVLLSLGFVFLTACQAKDSTSSPEIAALQQQLAEQKTLLESIKADLDGIRKGMGQVRQAPEPDDRPRPVSMDDDYIRGQVDAKVTLIEFSDFQCPFCERFYRETLPLIDKEYIQTGKVRMVYRDYPLEGVHKDAQKAAEAAQCAGEQGKYWEMHDAIFAHSAAMAVVDLKKHARALGLSAARFDKCVDSGQYAEEVKRDLADGQAVGVQGTPTFYVGLTGKDKTIHAIPIGGARPYAVFKQTIDKFLQEN